MRFWLHIQSLWPRFPLWPVTPFALWTCLWLGRGTLRWDHLAVTLLAGSLAYGSARTKRLFFCLLPVGLVGILYDAMRFVQNLGLTVETIHDCDLREHEVTLFGYVSDGHRYTLHDFTQAHASLPLDVIFAIPYGIFLHAIIGFSIYLFVQRPAAAYRFVWSFFFLNLLGFVTYHLYPAAPPWYYHAHHCLIDLATRASPGPNLQRVDAWLGVQYFTGFYGRSSDVFGAIPSLHVAYPLLMCIEGWTLHRWPGRTALSVFYVWMCCAAVYLDHHWVIDIAAGSLYTILVATVLRQLRPFHRAQDALA